MRIFRLYYILSLSIIVLVWVGLLGFSDSLPAEVPIHYNHKGEPDNFGPPYLLPMVGTILFFVLSLVLWAIGRYATIDKRIPGGKFTGPVLLLVAVIVALISLDSFIFHTDFNLPTETIICQAVYIFFLIIAGALPELKPNYFFGVRTSATLSHPYVWQRTHIFSANLLRILSLAGILISFFLPGNLWPFALLLIIVIVYAVASIRYANQVRRFHSKNN